MTETQRQKLVTVGLVGAGGVGKSTLMRMFESEGFALMPSVTRQYYAKKGVANEAEYFKLSEDAKKDFQRGMLDYYMETFDSFCRAHREENIIADRTVFDHLAYNLYSNAGMYTLKELEALLDTVKHYAIRAYTHIFYIPYPQPWMHHVSIEDGFRVTDPAKNFAVASIMHYALMTAKLRKVEVHSLEATKRTPDQTYEYMLDRIFIDLGYGMS